MLKKINFSGTTNEHGGGSHLANAEPISTEDILNVVSSDNNSVFLAPPHSNIMTSVTDKDCSTTAISVITPTDFTSTDFTSVTLYENYFQPEELFSTTEYNFSETSKNEALVIIPENEVHGLGLSLSPAKLTKTKSTPKYKLRKAARDAGQGYFTLNGKYVMEKIFTYITCSCRNACKHVSAEDRSAIFKQFWGMKNWQAQSNFIAQTVTLSTPKISRVLNSRKKNTRTYLMSGKKVCQLVYLRTLGISQKRVDFCLNKKSRNCMCSPDKRGNSTPNRTSDGKISNVKAFLDVIPKYESHYTTTKKKYFPAHLTKKKLYDMYTQQILLIDKVSFPIFCKVMVQYDVSIYRPKADSCQRCDAFNVKLKCVQEEERSEMIKILNNHQNRAAAVRLDLRNATKDAKTNTNLLVFTFDMQKTQPLPAINTSVAFYKRQLWIYNVGINRCHDNQGYM